MLKITTASNHRMQSAERAAAPMLPTGKVISRRKLTRDFKQTVMEHLERDPAFAKALLEEAALDRAEILLADETRFVVPQEMADAFCAALDSPARDILALTRLFADKSVLTADQGGTLQVTALKGMVRKPTSPISIAAMNEAISEKKRRRKKK